MENWRRYNLIGKTFVKLIVTNYSHTINSKNSYWFCDCSCGRKNLIIQRAALVSGATTSCGCFRKQQHEKYIENIRNEYINKKYNKLLILSINKIKTEKHKVCYVDCECDCGTITVLKLSSLKNNHRTSCGCKYKIYKSEDAASRYVFRDNYNDGDLTFEQFLLLSQKKCHYCGNIPNTVKIACKIKFIYNGLDRVDSKQKHNLKNCVPCCILCNRMKNNKNYNIFLNWIKKIYHFQFVPKRINEINFNFNLSNEFKNKFDFHPMLQSVKWIWKTTYKKELDFNIFLFLSQQNCFYCDDKPLNNYNAAKAKKNSHSFRVNNGNFIYNGLDRINNNLDHSYENVVSCCKQCNLAKSDSKIDFFYNHIKKIYDMHFE
jgi:hypothetical protein